VGHNNCLTLTFPRPGNDGINIFRAKSRRLEHMLEARYGD
jgi:hypothetical protein